MAGTMTEIGRPDKATTLHQSVRSLAVAALFMLEEFRYRARAIIAMIVMVLLVLMLGGVALIVGVFYPSRSVMAFCSRVWARAILFLAGVRLTIRGSEWIAGGAPRFYMGNHQSALDIPIMIHALRGNVRFMAKESLFRIPFFGWVIRRYGFIPIDRSNARRTLRTLDQMFTAVRRKPISVTVFPEGTRSRDGRLLPFRRGTMKVAQQVGFSVVPFAIDGSIRVLHPDRLLRVTPGPVTLSFAPPIAEEEVVQLPAADLQVRTAQAVADQLGQPVPAREVFREDAGEPPERCEEACAGKQ